LRNINSLQVRWVEFEDLLSYIALGAAYLKHPFVMGLPLHGLKKKLIISCCIGRFKNVLKMGVPSM
jgi:hypothetical protein